MLKFGKEMTLTIPAAVYENLELILQKIYEQRPAPSGARAQGLETFDAIIKEARSIYIEEGHAGLTIGKVAQRSGYNKGNIGYYFATKDDLLRSILLEELVRYLQRHLEQARESKKAGLDLLMETVGEYISETRFNSEFFLQSWGYAISDEGAKELVIELYSVILDFLSELAMSANPTFTKSKAKFASLQIMMLVEGMTTLNGLALLNDRSFSQLRKRTMGQIESLITNP